MGASQSIKSLNLSAFARFLLVAAFVIAVQGGNSLWAQAASTVTMQATLVSTPPSWHAATGNPNLDAFYKIEDALSVGGDIAQQRWRRLKGRPLGLLGYIDSVREEAPHSCLVRVDITPQARSQHGTYNIVFEDSQTDARYLKPGNQVRFQGTIASYTFVPTFTLTLKNARLDESALKAAKDKAKERRLISPI